MVISNLDPDESNTDNNQAHNDFGVPVELLGFSTEVETDGTVLIRWQTASETINKGWNIWRRPFAGNPSEKEKINKNLIKGAGTTPFGEVYEFVDDTVNSRLPYAYTLEWISTNGKVERSKEILIGKQIGNFHTALTEENPDILARNSESGIRPAEKAETNWRTEEHSADYLIIVPGILKDAIKPLANFRKSHGHKVEIVSLEDIYALFPNFTGEKAIRRFIRFVYNHWSVPRLRYVLLVGDAVMTKDGKQRISQGLLPTFVRKMPGVGLIPTDYPYACLADNDSIPELVVGRLPASSTSDVRSMVKKIIRNDNSPATSRVAIFANGDYVKPGDEYAETSSEAIIRDFCEGSFDIIRIYTMPMAESLQQYQGTADDLAVMLRRGCSWVEFKGHGAASLWAGLLDARRATTIRTLDQLPIINSVSCFTGFFADPNQRVCMAEALLRNPFGGAVAYIGNTGHGMLYTGHDFSNALWDQLKGEVTIGDAVFNAKKRLAEKGGDKGFLHSINLFGDPLTKVRFRRQ